MKNVFLPNKNPRKTQQAVARFWPTTPAILYQENLMVVFSVSFNIIETRKTISFGYWHILLKAQTANIIWPEKKNVYNDNPFKQ